MDRQHHVKVTYIETQFVTSDAAGFKDLVQRLTGRSPTAAPAPAAPRHTGRTAAAGPQGNDYRRQAAGEVRCPGVVASGAPPMDDDFSDLFYVGAGEQRRHGSFNGGYSDLLYWSTHARP